MGSSRSAIADDVAQYLHLCKKYDEPPVMIWIGSLDADPYGEHATELLARHQKEMAEKAKETT